VKEAVKWGSLFPVVEARIKSLSAAADMLLKYAGAGFNSFPTEKYWCEDETGGGYCGPTAQESDSDYIDCHEKFAEALDALTPFIEEPPDSTALAEKKNGGSSRRPPAGGRPRKYSASLRQAIIEQGGLRFSVLEAHMPCETSSGAAGHTNGLYPIRQHVMVKTSGSNKVTFIAPEAEALKDAYQLAWDLEWKDLTDLYAIVQCFSGQGISADYYVRYTPDNLSISGKKLLTDWLYRVKMGMKSRYYINTSSALAAKEESSAPVCDSCSL
jgi:hypothetical protein